MLSERSLFPTHISAEESPHHMRTPIGGNKRSHAATRAIQARLAAARLKRELKLNQQKETKR
jgi:hypothetical protein